MAKFKVKEDASIRPGPGKQFDPPYGVFKKGEIIEEFPTEGWLGTLVEDEDGVLDIGWVSKKLLVPAPTDAQTPTAPAVEPVHIRWARSKLGMKETPGTASNPEIDAWFSLTTLPKEYWTDSTAWCAVFANAALLLNNIPSLRSALAADYLKLGAKTTTPKKGDLVVWAHHVAFFLADLGNGRIQVIGGNQGDAVTITTYPKDNAILGYRRVV